MENYYIMKKIGWDHKTGEYSAIEKQTGPLTLRQVKSRVKRLPDSTIWLWTIYKYPDGRSAPLISAINAEEFKACSYDDTKF